MVVVIWTPLAVVYTQGRSPVHIVWGSDLLIEKVAYCLRCRSHPSVLRDVHSLVNHVRVGWLVRGDVKIHRLQPQLSAASCSHLFSDMCSSNVVAAAFSQPQSTSLHLPDVRCYLH